MGWLLGLINPLAAIGQQLATAYAQKQNAQTDQARIAAEVQISELEARRDVILSSVNDKWWSPRVIMGWAVAAYVVKIIFIDTVLGLGSTPNPGVIVGDIVKVVIGFYFASKAVEVAANSVSSAISKRRK